MFDLRQNVSRLSDELAGLGDDLVRRARPVANDLAKRAQPYGREAADRAASYADDIIARAKPYAERLKPHLGAFTDQLTTYADDWRRKARHGIEPLVEERSFMNRPAGKIAGAAALGVLAGLAFGVVRKATVQGAEALNGDWLEVLKAEHKAVDKLFEALLATTDQQKIRRGLLLGRIAAALAKHGLQEESVIYPALKESSADGKAMNLYEDHAQIKIFIHELQEIAKDDPLWIAKVQDFHQHVARHVREEEDEIFPAYHGRMSPQQNRRLTLMVHREGLKLA